MRINVSPGRINNNNLVIDGGGGFPQPPTTSMSELFNVETFELSTNEVRPFQEVTISWSIVAIDNTINMADYRFRLKIMGDSTPVDADLAANGSVIHRPLKKLYYVITAEPRGNGSGQTISQKLLMNVDDTDCVIISLTKDAFNSFAISEFDRFMRETKGLQKRKKPVGPDNVDRGYYEVKTVFEDIPNVIKVSFPFEINTPNFFDADLDVKLKVFLSIDHNESESFLDVHVDIDSDFDYNAGEHILTAGCTGIVSKAMNSVLPMVMESKKAGIERAIANGIVSFVNIFGILDTKRMLSVNILSDEIAFVLCEEAEAVTPNPIGGNPNPRNPAPVNPVVIE